MRSKTPLLIMLAALLILGLIVFFGVRHRIRQMRAALPGALRAELQQRLNRSVTFGSFELPSPDTAVITDLRIGEKASFGRGTFFTCPRLIVRFNAFDLITGRRSLPRSIISVTVVEPTMRVTRNPRGKFNVEDLIVRPPLPPNMRFLGIVEVHSGRLILSDYAANARPLPGVNTVSAMNAHFDFSHGDYLTLDLDARGDQARLGGIKAAGRWGARNPNTNVHLMLRDADARYWLHYFATIPDWDLKAGRFDADATVFSTSKSTLTARGLLRLRGASVVSAHLAVPIEPFGAELRFAGTSLQVSGRGNLKRSPVLIRGTVQGPALGNVNIAISSDRMDFAVLQSAIRPRVRAGVGLSGQGTLVVRITGTTRDPSVTMQASIPKAVIQGVTSSEIRAQASYSTGRFQVQGISARVAGGRVSLTGSGGVQPVSFNGRGTASGIRLADLPPHPEYPVSGTADARFSLVYARGSPSATASLTISNARVGGIPVQTATASVSVSRSGVTIRDPVVRSEDTSIIGTGDIAVEPGRPPRFDIHIRAENVDLARLDALLKTRFAVKGIARADVNIRGRPPQLRVAGEAEVRNAVVSRVSFDRVRIAASFSGADIVLDEIAAEKGTMRVVGRGRVGANGTLGLDLAGQNLDLDLVNDALKPFVKLEGPLNLQARVTRTIKNPLIQGAISASSPKINGVQFDSLSASASWDGAAILATNITLKQGASQYAIAEAKLIPASGAYEIRGGASAGDISAMLEVLRKSPAIDTPEGAGLRDFLAAIPMPAKGVFDASLTLAGSKKTLPSLTASLAAHGVSLAGTEIGEVSAGVRSTDKTIALDRLTISGPTGQVSAHGSIGMDGRLDIAGEVKALSLSLLDPLLTGDHATGALDMGFTIGGEMSSPEVRGQFRASGIKTAEFCATSISAPEFTLNSERFSFERVIIQQDGSKAVVSGYLPFSWSAPFIPRDKPFSVRLSLANQSLEILKCFSKSVSQARGKIEASAVVSGTLDAPSFTGEIAIRDGSVNVPRLNNTFKGITLSARLEGPALQIQNLSGESSLGGTFSGGGSVALWGEGRTIQAFLNLMSLRLATVGPTGPVEFTATGHLTASESLKSPLAQGQIVVSDARIVFPAKELETTVTIPPLPVNPQLDVTVNLAKNVVVERGALQVEVSGPISVTGAFPNPLIVGTVQITRGRLAFPGRTLTISPGGTASLLLRPPEPAVITVDLTATTSVTTLSGITGHVARYRVYLDISGPIGDLSIGVRSSPPGLAGIEALATVFGGSALEALARGEPAQQLLQQQLGQVLLGFAVPGLFQPITAGGITLGITPGLYVPLELSISAFLSDKVVLTYSQSLVGTMPYDTFAASYALSPQLALTWQFEGPYWTPDEATLLVEYYKNY